MRSSLRIPFALLIASLFMAGSGLLFAQVPAEVTGVTLNGGDTLAWDLTTSAEDYNVYRGLVSWLSSGNSPRCHGDEIVGTSFSTAADPDPGETYFYLVTAESVTGEGTPGTGSGSSVRPLLGSCDAVMRNHLFDRLGFGWDEWSRDRLATLGVDAFIAEQLDPASIDESTNTALNNRLLFLEPPESHIELLALPVVKGTYARRQFEQQVASFFTNHFTTYFGSVYVYYLGLFPPCGQPPLPFCDPDYPAIALGHAAIDQYNETEGFRDLAFNGTFRDMLELSAKSPAMIYFLDTFNNLAIEPNENYARELMELHSMDVETYVHHDIGDLARVFTGWNVCAKLPPATGPIDPCDIFHWQPGREFVANFNITNHDCEAKALFVGTPSETNIPDTCDGGGLPTAAGVNDVALALNAIAGHSATSTFIAKKLLRRFVTESPTQTMIDTVVSAWNDTGNPNGAGDMREVLRSVMELAEFRDPDRLRQKIKTPTEHVISALRATRARTDGVTLVLDYLIRLQELPYFLTTPDGYSERGGDWIGTNNMLDRQNFGLHLTTNEDPETIANFGTDIILMLQQNGVSTAAGNTEAIVDFFIDALYGGALTPTERQEAIDYLNTDDNGAISAYDDFRIRETVGFMLGYAQFEEQ